MKQYKFEAKHAQEWEQFERYLNQQASVSRQNSQSWVEFSSRYRQICQCLALARSRNYSVDLQNRLNHLVLAGQQLLYPDRTPLYRRLSTYFLQTFPRAVRRDRRWVAWSALLFIVVMLVTGGVVYHSPALVYTVLPEKTVRDYEQLYRLEAVQSKRPRSADDDLRMFGFYLSNNTAIGFKLYAGGVFGGLGTLVALLGNGAYFGALGGYLTQAGLSRTLYGFVAGHSAFEFSAIILAGAAGFQLGFALLFPGRRSRLRSFRRAARDSLELVYGMATLLVLAAFVEAFWSSLPMLSLSVKLGGGGVMWIALLSYFYWMGRGDAD